MATQTEPTDGFLDKEFASFRQSRLRARRASEEAALEPRRKAEPADSGASPPVSPPVKAVSAPGSIEAMLDGLDGEASDATRAGQRDDLPKINKVPTMSAIPDLEAADETRSHARADLPAESCSDPEFEKFRAARTTARAPRGDRPSSGTLKRPAVAERAERVERPGSAALKRPVVASEGPEAPADDVAGSCSDPEFEKFRAARRPDSARFRKPEASSDALTSTEAAPAAPAPARGDATCSDPEFEKFRAARQGRPDSARHRKPDALAAEVAPAPAPAPAATPEPVPAEQAAAEAAAPDDDTLFFGTSVHERAKVRARVLESRSDLDDIVEPTTSPEAAEPPSERPTPSQGERRRAPPPPLPERA